MSDADEHVDCEQLLYSVFTQTFLMSQQRQSWAGEF